MRALALAVVLLFSVGTSSIVTAQPKPAQQKKEQKGGATTIRYIDLALGTLGDSAVETILKETRQGNTLVSAVLDVCYSVTASTGRKDRFVVTLTPQGGKLVGTGQTEEDKLPVRVELVRKVVDKSYAFEGTIRYGATEAKVETTDNSEMTEAEYAEQQVVDTPPVAAPADFAELAPGSLSVRIKRPSLAEMVKALKPENVKVDLASLMADCKAVRTGVQELQVEVDPYRAPALVAKLASTPGVVAVGWRSGPYTVNQAIRLGAQPWLSGATPDKAQLAAAIAAAAAKHLSGTVLTTTWDATTGELSLKVRRPNESYRGLGLTDTVELTVLASPEKPGATDAVVLWLGYTNIVTTDEGPEPRVTLGQPATEGEHAPQTDTVNAEALLEALAKELKGQLWDGDKLAWK